LAKGFCEVFIMDEQKVNRWQKNLSPGTFFGEINMIYNCKRTASVRSKNYCTLAMLEKKHFVEITESHPDFIDMMKEYI
jgi:CRP-like cAMP-binding protein